jgi:heat shock protein HtpX
MDDRVERKFILDGIKSNRRRIILDGFAFFLIILAVAFLIAILIRNPTKTVWIEMLLVVAAIAAAITLVVFPLIFYWGLRRSAHMFPRLFRKATLSELDSEKLRLATEGVCLACGAEGVRVEPVAMQGINCITSGLGSDEAIILISQAAVEMLNRDQLEALLAHEIYHIKTRETRLWALGIGLSGFILVRLAADNINPDPGDLAEDPILKSFEGNPAIGYLIRCLTGYWFILLLPFWIAFYLLGLPKSRDYLADEHAILITHSPESMIKVIEMSDISRSENTDWGSLFFNHMYFNQPLPPRAGARILARMLNTHPPASKRIERIRSMV